MSGNITRQYPQKNTCVDITQSPNAGKEPVLQHGMSTNGTPLLNDVMHIGCDGDKCVRVYMTKIF